jgi:hypothetical protein
VRAQWLTVQSFQHGQELLAAINTLSIQLKLREQSAAGPDSAKAVEDARRKLDRFLEEMEQMIGGPDGKEVNPLLLGTNPRTRELAESFEEARKDRTRFRSELFQGDIANVRQLLDSNAKGDEELLLRCLDELRMLLQEHVQADATQIMGQI